MSASSLPREMGTWIKCDGTADKGCPKNERRFTANIVIGHNRDFLVKDGWGRGLRTGYKRRDLCPSCLATERELHKEAEALKEQRKQERAERKKAKFSAAPLPKKSRKRAAASSTAPSSPSAEPAPAPAT